MAPYVLGAGKEEEMKRLLEFEIECGEKTCARIPGEFCRFFRPHLSGKATCYFFGEVWPDKPLGWTQRHPDCVAQEKRREE